MSHSEESPLVTHANLAYKIMQSFNVATADAVIAAPYARELLESLALATTVMADVSIHVASALGRSLYEFDVYDGQGVDPRESVAHAIDHLVTASALAKELADELDRARNAIRNQGFHSTSDPEDPEDLELEVPD